MSNSPVIPKEKLSAYQRWELHSFDGPTSPHPGRAARAAAESADKVQDINQRAYQTGHAEGLRAGNALAAANAQALLELLGNIKQRSSELDQTLADELLGVALEIARQITRHALAFRPQVIIPLVQDALARVPQPAAQASITLHPEDAKLVREHLGEELTAGGWKIVEDAGMARGGCVLQSSACHIDATLPTRWHQLGIALGQNTQWLD